MFLLLEQKICVFEAIREISECVLETTKFLSVLLKHHKIFECVLETLQNFECVLETLQHF